MSSLARHKAKRILLVLLVLCTAAYLSASALVSFGVQHWLRGQGFNEISLGNVDVEPLAGELRLQQLFTRRDGGPPLALGEGYLNINWPALLYRRAVLQGLNLKGVKLTVAQDAQGNLVISGLPLPASSAQPTTGEPWSIGLDHLAISDSQITLALQGFQHRLKLDSLVLDGLRSWDAEHPARLDLDARLDDTRIRIEGALLPFADNPGGKLRLRIDGLDTAALIAELRQSQPDLLPANLQLQSGSLDTDMQLDIRLMGTRPIVDQRGAVTLRDLSLQLDDQPQAMEQLQWNGALHWDADKGLNITGLVNLRRLALTHQGRTLALGSVDWDGRIDWSEPTGLSASGDAQATDLEARQPAQQLLLARLQTLQITGLQLDNAQQVTLDDTILSAPLLLQTSDETAPLLRASTVHISASRLQPDAGIALGQITLQGADINITLAADGKLPGLDALQAGNPASSETADTARATPLSVSLAGVALDDQSTINFHDLSTAPAFHQQLGVERLEVGAMNNAMPDDWTTLTLAGRLGEYSRIDLSGRARPFTEQLNLELSGKVQRLDLQPLSSYTSGKLGYNLRSGQMDGDINLKISDDQLDGVTQLVINKLTVKAADTDRMAQLTRELSMPLDSALNMLRDSDDNIRIKLPVTGDIHKPDFDLSDLINKALGKALKSAAISYVKFALQPYGTLISLAQLAGKAANRVALEAINFPPAATAVGADASPYLDKLSGLLQERPQLRFQICGIASEADRQALLQTAIANQASSKQAEASKPAAPPATPVVRDADLLKLAEQRAANIKRLLVARGASPDRLFVCTPEIDKDSTGKPRADLLL